VERADRKPSTTDVNDLADAFDAKPQRGRARAIYQHHRGEFPPPNPLLVIEVRSPAFRIR
jgi:Uma2 family endonuclease